MLRATYAKLILEDGSLREHLVVAPPCRLAIELDPILFRRPNDAGSELTTTIAVKMCAGQSAVACLFALHYVRHSAIVVNSIVAAQFSFTRLVHFPRL